MSNSRNHKPALLNLEGHNDTSSGPSTDESTPRENRLADLGPLPRPDASDLSREPSPDMVRATTPRSNEPTPRLSQGPFQPSRNASAMAKERSDAVLNSESSQAPDQWFNAVDSTDRQSAALVAPPNPLMSNLTTPALSPSGQTFPPSHELKPVDYTHDLGTHAGSPSETTATAANTSAQPSHAIMRHSSSSPDLHGQPSISSISASMSPRPAVTINANPANRAPQTGLRGDIPEELPERDEPPAPTTISRIARQVRGLFRGRNNEPDGIEMNIMSVRASMSDPRLLGADGQRQALSVQPMQQRSSTEGRGMSREKKEMWTWIGCFVSAATLGTVIYVATREGK